MQTSIAHFTIATRDVAQTAAFFTHTLGWPPIERPGNLDQAAVILRFVFRTVSSTNSRNV